MTPPEAAKALAKQIVAECYKGPFARYGSVHDWEQCIETHLTAALHAAEQLVWEKVLDVLSDFRSEGKSDLRELRERLRQQKGQVGDE